jgi:hypothetical protein
MTRPGDDMRKFRWWQVHPRLAVAVVVVVLAALSGASFYFWPRTVYVTDGSHEFSQNLAAVEKKIKAENDWVMSQGAPYVSIAVMATMDPHPNLEPLDENRTRHGIEGAYLAQYEANHPGGADAKPGAPLVRLLLADMGSQETSWLDAAQDLEARVDTDQHLVAVTGLGISVENTRRVIAELADRHHIALVGSVVTGDNIGSSQGMVRVSPTNTDEAQAAVKFLDSDPDANHPLPDDPGVWLVQDQNSADDYASSLASGFTEALRSSTRHAHLIGSGTQYNSALPEAPTVLGDVGIGDRICRANADIVYFAGRGVDFQGFLEGLAHRYCAAQGKHLTVLTGSDATQLINHTPLWTRDGADMSVYFTALAHPQMWQDRPETADQETTSWFGSGPHHFGTEFADETLEDGWAIMFHDGVTTAVTATRKLFGRNGSVPPAGGVAQQFNELSVHGASGYLCFNAQHNPINKAIPIVALDQNGASSYRELSSAAGSPPTADNCY